MEYSCSNYRALLLYVTALCTKNIFVIINSFASRLLRMGEKMSTSFSSITNLGLSLTAPQERWYKTTCAWFTTNPWRAWDICRSPTHLPACCEALQLMQREQVGKHTNHHLTPTGKTTSWGRESAHDLTGVASLRTWGPNPPQNATNFSAPRTPGWNSTEMGGGVLNAEQEHGEQKASAQCESADMRLRKCWAIQTDLL